jgi:GDP-4-dehydro-6-deoxy-D-mannose reductase
MALHRILVTGGSGFVGAHLLPTLAQAFPQAALHSPGFDVTDPMAVSAIIDELRPNACVHLAAISAVRQARQDPERAWRVNLHGTLNLAGAILAHAPECAFLFVSSAEAYGRSFRAGRMLDESAPLAPMNTYAASKAAADLAVGALASQGLRVIRVRPFNHTGPGQSTEFVVSGFAEQIARIGAGTQPPILRVGALDPERDFLDVRDVCAAYVACLRGADAFSPDCIFNIASGTARRIGDILRALLALAGVEARIETDPGRLRRSEIPLACGDATRARSVLGWQPRIAWEQTLRDTLAYWQERVAREG